MTTLTGMIRNSPIMQHKAQILTPRFWASAKPASPPRLLAELPELGTLLSRRKISGLVGVCPFSRDMGHQTRPV